MIFFSASFFKFQLHWFSPYFFAPPHFKTTPLYSTNIVVVVGGRPSHLGKLILTAQCGTPQGWSACGLAFFDSGCLSSVDSWRCRVAKAPSWGLSSVDLWTRCVAKAPGLTSCPRFAQALRSKDEQARPSWEGPKPRSARIASLRSARLTS